jgi:hypothetical protein
MREKHHLYASPVLNTYLNLQKPASFDVVVIEPEIVRRPGSAVIFLHGYMGNVSRVYEPHLYS